MIYTFKDIKSDINETADVCIIGSGAGGAVAAKEIAEKGLKVILLEEGGYYTSRDYGNRKPSEITQKLYRDAGSIMTLGLPIIMIPLGRCVGGTTVINSGTCFRTPDSVIKRWQVDAGFKHISPDTLRPYFEKVEKFINVSETPEHIIGGSAKIVREGANKLGYKSGPILRNMRNCEGCGVCAFGCPTDAKQAMHITYIPEASKNGALIYANCRAEKLIVQDGKITSVEGVFLDENDQPFSKITINCKATVVSCGAIHTPALLMKNRMLKTKHLGKHLHIHPATRVVALFDHVVEGWKGVPQSYKIHEFADEGIMLEGFFVPPGVGAGTLPFVGQKHKDIMFRYKHLAGFGVMISDTSEGKITIDRNGNPVITYWLNNYDKKRLLKGIYTIAEIFLSAGSKEIYTGLREVPIIKSRKDLNALLDNRIPASHLELMAFHPMGTARMGQDITTSVVNEFLETHEIKNLFIVDASIFPSSLGVNPQLSIMAFSAYFADHLVKNWAVYK
jgi:choline dehydrogenase-like flavoprotein